MAVENILTVDVEDWYHICGVTHVLPRHRWPQLESRVKANTHKILDILNCYRVQATFFVLGYVAERHPDLIAAISSRGHEIASHGYSHRRVYTMTPAQFRADLRKSIAIISGITGTPVCGYRAPEWSIREDSRWALDILLEEGITFDSSMAPLHIIGNPKYRKIPHWLSLRNGRMLEVPPLVLPTGWINWPAGGGWGLRTLAYRWIRSRIEKLNQTGQPAVIFIHPREFDLLTPRLRLPRIKNFVLFAGVEPTQTRLQRLLKDFRFTHLSRAVGQLRL
ncbi:MAG: polysaccharide deacetylase family protein [Desulfobacterales bacterium]|jgi:polysaccharide deacetylase family protein (PEP-CTERM system associated)|nr:polysaccharide deacetylase family protein [Desulfobacterales bacterium]